MEVDLPEGWTVLSEWDVMPAQLAAAIERATVLVVLDPLSFPFEALDAEQWDVPFVLLLPAEFEAEVLDDMFGTPAFGRLGFFDRIATGDTELWESLSRKYRWTAPQYIGLESADPADAALEIQARLEKESSSPAPLQR